PVQGDLNTPAGGFPNVGGQQVRKVCSCRYWYFCQQVGGGAIIGINASREAVIEEPEVDPRVISLQFFPFQVGVEFLRSKRWNKGVSKLDAGAHAAGGIYSQIAVIGTYLLVSRYSIPGPQL